MTSVLDFHAHILTPHYLSCLERHNALLEDGFPLPQWQEEEHLAFMERNHIFYTLLSLSSPHPYYGDLGECREVVASINETCAQLKDKHPGKFGFAAALPLPDIAASVAEAVRAMDTLGAVGVKLGSNTAGLYLGDPRLDPIFEVVNARGGILIIHPHAPAQMSRKIFTAGPVPLYEFLCDTTRGVLNMMAQGFFSKFPQVKVVVPHCGSFLPNIMDRLRGIQPILMKGGFMETPIDVDQCLKGLYFDLAGHPVPHLLPLLETITTPDHILFGSDYPFTPEPGIRATLDRLAQQVPSSKLEGYLWDNGARLLGL